MPRGKPGEAAAADAGIVPGVFVGQRVMDISIVQAHGFFCVDLSGSTFPHEEVTGPKHMMRLDGNARIAHQLCHFGASQAYCLGSARMPTDHVVLRAPAKGSKSLRLVAELVAQLLRSFVRGQDLPGAPSLGGHPGDADKLLVLQFNTSTVRRFRLRGKNTQSLLKE